MEELWSEINGDLLEEIGKGLGSYADYLRFRAVCASWRRALPEKPSHLRCQLPWLMLPPVDDGGTCYGFFSIKEKEVYKFDLPEVQGKRCRGSSHGWMITMEEEGPSIHLINPLTRLQIHLPPLFTFPNVLEYHPDRADYQFVFNEPERRFRSSRTSTWTFKELRRFFIDKVVLSSNPSTNSGEFITMAIHGEFCQLAFCRRGDEGWTLIEYGERKPYEDIIYCKDKFFAVRCDALVIAIDFINTGSSSSPTVTQISPPSLHPRNCTDDKYLVESSGELFLIERRVPLRPGGKPRLYFYRTAWFRVYKLDQNQRSWIQLRSLGDHALFLGVNSSLSFSIRDFPELKRNCIYFTDDMDSCHKEGIIGGFDVGIFNLEKDLIEPLPEPLPSYMGDSQLIWPPPIWVTPNFCYS